ncbi:oxepin-CoA hydrolase, alternative type [uncultured Sulfitobacter sp.]|uniref:oxepin-CoA hydrolase, alternative type n=1 Tax=uncultured Sulfitobacter sp. TaxID=191468 RepID=UPI00262C5CC2|nr:enoyl-CoA hydratase family protein [uncultured Sulfitobacter sp.]
MSARLEDAGDRLIIWNGNTDKRGALSPELYECIMKACEMASERRLRSIVLTSEGPFFCAGGDLTQLIKSQGMPADQRAARIDSLHDVIRAMRACPVPIIAAVEGGAAGAGLSIALSCDVVVAAKGAKFVASYVKAGLVPDGGLTAHLARSVPRQLAMEMCMLAQPVLAERMYDLAVVNALTEVGDAMDVARQYADRFGAGPRDAQAAIRKMVAAAYDTTEAEQLDHERDAMGHATGAPEAAEGIAAFLEKRSPNYS